MTSEIIAVGTELLAGDTVNTNASYIAKSLMELGSGTLYQSVVGDNPKRLTDTLAAALQRSEIIVLTGGLGPTDDDLTKETAAALLGLELVEDEPSMEAIRRYFVRKNLPMPEINRKQALIPKHAAALPNSTGTAPGVLFDFDRLFKAGKIYSNYKCRWLFLLPGPPREMKPMWDRSCVPFLQDRLLGTGVLVSHYFKCFGIGEASATELVRHLLNGSNPTVSPYVKDGSTTFRITAHAADRSEAERLMAPIISEMESILGEWHVGTDVSTLEEIAVKLLLEKKLTVSAAESCTGGLISKKLTDIPGCSGCLGESYVTYSNGAKMRHLGVRKETLDAVGAVSAETASEMALGAKRVSGSDFALAVTGIAGPGGGSDEKPVGLVFSALAHPDGHVDVFKNIYGHGEANERDYIRELTASGIIWELIKALRKL